VDFATLIGLVQMLSNMEEPKSIGPAIIGVERITPIQGPDQFPLEDVGTLAAHLKPGQRINQERNKTFVHG